MSDESQQETIRQRGIHGQGLAPESDLIIPEPHYQCENFEAGLNLADDHFIDGGYFPPGELQHARFDVKEYATLFEGYWCVPCLDALGVKRRGPTLDQALKDNLVGRISAALAR